MAIAMSAAAAPPAPDAAAPLQPTLFGSAPVGFRSAAGIPHTALAHGAWYAYAPGWLHGDQEVFDAIRETTRWNAQRRPMYDRVVDVPRLTASLPRDGDGHPVLAEVAGWLADRYGEPFDKISVNWYRDGSDSVAPHGDQIVRNLETSVMAILSLGARRRFVLSPSPRRDGGDGGGDATAETVRLDLGAGDLLVLGGTIQRTWRHAVPKTTKAVGPRICVMFRPPWLG